MKNSVVLIFFVMLGMLACQGEDHQQQSNSNLSKNSTFKSDSLHTEFEYPQNWIIRNIEGRIGVYEPLKDSLDVFEENILIWNEEIPIPISDSLFGKTATAEIKIKNPSIVITEHGMKTIGTRKFYYFEFNYKNQDSIEYHIDGYTTVQDKRGYNFSCTSDLKSAGKHKETIEKILSSFKPI